MTTVYSTSQKLLQLVPLPTNTTDTDPEPADTTEDHPAPADTCVLFVCT